MMPVRCGYFPVMMLARAGVHPPLRHAANSAATMWHPASRYDLVRCGIALYGLAPGADGLDREPVPDLRAGLSLKARVSHVQELPAGAPMAHPLFPLLWPRAAGV